MSKKTLKYLGVGVFVLLFIIIGTTDNNSEPEKETLPILEEEIVIEEKPVVEPNIAQLPVSQPSVIIPEPEPAQEQIKPEPVVPQEYQYYTSAHHSAKYYYPKECGIWQELSSDNLRGFVTLDELLSQYHRELSPQC